MPGLALSSRPLRRRRFQINDETQIQTSDAGPHSLCHLHAKIHRGRPVPRTWARSSTRNELLAGEHDAIIDPAVWQRVQDVLHQQKKARTRWTTRKGRERGGHHTANASAPVRHMDCQKMDVTFTFSPTRGNRRFESKSRCHRVSKCPWRVAGPKKGGPNHPKLR